MVERLTQEDMNAIAQLAHQRPDDWVRLSMRLRILMGGPAFDPWERRIKALVKAIAVPVAEYIPNAPEVLDELTEDIGVTGLESPGGYSVRFAGIFLDDTQITTAPIVITGEAIDVDSGEVSVGLAWTYRMRWKQTTVDRGKMTDARKIGALALLGFPVNSDNATNIVRYLSAFAAHNMASIPEVQLSTRCGWVGRSFLRGHNCHGGDLALSVDGGLERIAKGFDAKGDYGAWRRMIREYIAQRPSMLLGVYASACAPLLEVLQIPGFVIDWSGTTGRGKSTALQVAASVWGDYTQIVQPWDVSSTVGPQTIAGFVRHLPLLMDDTKRAESRSQVIADMIYAIPDGRERVRGKKDGGLRESKQWRTVLLSTGERKITSFSGDAGARGRSLCLPGTPMGKDTPENALAAEEIKLTAMEHCGHVGAELIEWLRGADWDDLRKRHAEYRAAYVRAAPGSTARRLGSAVAAVQLTAEILADLGLPATEDQQNEAISLAWNAALDSGADSDQPLAALRDLWNWVNSNGARMAQYGVGAGREPSMGWAGVWDLDGGRLVWWAVNPTTVRELLERWGRDPDYCVTEWARRRWLTCNQGLTYPVKFTKTGKQSRMYRFLWDNVSEVLGDEEVR